MINFEAGTLVKGAYVEIDGKEYPVHMPEYSGSTPVSSENMNKLQGDLQKEINEAKEACNKEIEQLNNFSEEEIVIGKRGEKLLCIRRLTGEKKSGTDLTFDLANNAGDIMFVKGKLHANNDNLSQMLPFYESASIWCRVELLNHRVRVKSGTDTGYSNGMVFLDVEYTRSVQK